MRKKYSKLLVVVVFTVFVSCFLFAGRFLSVSETPEKSDVIIVLGGGGNERELEASKLYKEGYSEFVMLSNGGSREKPSIEGAKKEIKWLISYGVPEKAIIPEFSALSTYGNAVYSKRLMEKKHFKSAIVVSSTYHMRRTKFIFGKVYSNSSIKLFYHAAEGKDYNPSFWWTTPIGRTYTTQEYTKLIGYYIYYGLLGKASQ